jgi:glycosyltransferase involved in cell wall biosynthesis
MKNIKKKKVHNILYTTSFSNMAGGGQWSLYYLIKHLNREIFHPFVLCPDEGELAQKMREIGADVILLNTGKIRHLNPYTIKRLSSIIRDKNISLIHTDSTTETFYAGIAARVNKIPLIWHIRASQGEWFLDRVLSALSTRLILVADALRNRFKWLDTGKAPTIYNGIDLEEFDAFITHSSIREEFNLDNNAVLLGCVGRIEELKGQEYLIKALKHTNNARLILAGRANDAYLKRISKMCEELNVSERVIFAGHRDDIPSFLKSIDILVLPTLTEAFSRVILEAMAASKPVIATDTGGNPEAVINGTTGYIVPIKDTAALADKVNELAEDAEKRKQMGRAGRKRVEERFAIEKSIEMAENIYLEVLKK